MSEQPRQLPNKESFLIYKSEDDCFKLDVRLQNETLWLTQPHMAKLFQTTQQNISQHILNIYEENELEQMATHKKFLSVRQEGSRQVQRKWNYYNLDLIISVGYRVKSRIATRFSIWAKQRLKEYILKGIMLGNELLQNGCSILLGGGIICTSPIMGKALINTYHKSVKANGWDRR